MNAQRAERRAEGVRSLERGLALLKAMNADPRASVTALAGRIGVPRSTAYRLLDTLVKLGLVAPDSATGGYTLTREVYKLSTGFLDEEWIEGAWLELVTLGEQIIWPVDLFTREAATMLVRRSTHARSSMSIDYGMTGRRLGITETASGRAYLAFCPAAERELILGLPDALQRGGGQLERDLVDRQIAQARATGFGTRVGGIMPKTASIGIAVMLGDRVLCCVSVIIIASALPIERAITEFGPPLREAAARIGRIAQQLQHAALPEQTGRA